MKIIGYKQNKTKQNKTKQNKTKQNKTTQLYFFLHRYWDTLLDMLWPRFTFVIQQNIESIRLIDPQKMGTIDVQPHYVSLRLSFIRS
jgi:hypothetical protein